MSRADDRWRNDEERELTDAVKRVASGTHSMADVILIAAGLGLTTLTRDLYHQHPPKEHPAPRLAPRLIPDPHTF